MLIRTPLHVAAAAALVLAATSTARAGGELPDYYRSEKVYQEYADEPAAPEFYPAPAPVVRENVEVHVSVSSGGYCAPRPVAAPVLAPVIAAPVVAPVAAPVLVPPVPVVREVHYGVHHHGYAVPAPVAVRPATWIKGHYGPRPYGATWY